MDAGRAQRAAASLAAFPHAEVLQGRLEDVAAERCAEADMVTQGQPPQPSPFQHH